MYLITLGGDSEGILSFMRRFRGCDEVSHRSSRMVVAGASGVGELGGSRWLELHPAVRAFSETGGGRWGRGAR
jgi:hypothetical protein